MFTNRCAICEVAIENNDDLCASCKERVGAVIAKDLARKNIQATLDMHRERGASKDLDSDSTGFK